ncbi:hypothetical protein SDC9_112140 [bioreactor metagenome]|uniref:NADP-dependent oxidoreductase domain-containing protein n=1 Tax=bioreactor metagenome TaxID=1076179 RepID=A0A645BIN4_9ZZZZ
MRDKHCRAEMIISCKGCHDAVLVPTDNALTSQRAEPQLHRADIIKAIDVSLMNLMTDYLDIFTLHKDNPAVPVAEIITTLQEQKQQGKILAYGCSNWTVERQREAVSYALSHGCDGFSVDQIGWCLNVQNVDSPSYKTKVLMDDEAYRFHQQSKIPVMAYAANGRAYFHRLANQLEVRDQERSEYDNDINRRILAVLMQAAQETGAEVNTIVISYLLLDHGFQTIPIIGVKSIRELDICLAALDYQLPTVFEQQLRALTR